MSEVDQGGPSAGTPVTRAEFDALAARVAKIEGSAEAVEAISVTVARDAARFVRGMNCASRRFLVR